MRRSVASILLDVPPAVAFATCLRLLETPDAARGVVARVAKPSPPRLGSLIVTTVRGRGGAAERELRSRVAVLDAPRELATETLDAVPAVRTSLCVTAQGAGSRVTLTSEVEAPLGEGRAAGVLGALLFARAQRRSADATLRLLKRLSADPPAPSR